MNDQEVIDGLDIRCEREYFDKVVSFAKKIKQWEGEQGLKSNLERIISLHRSKDSKPMLYSDFAPYSFGFSASIFAGACIYRGTENDGEDGNRETFSVSLSPNSGWSLNT